MKILLDECLPIDFRHSFPAHDTHTVQCAGFKGKNNGDLLRAAEGGGYEVFITVDQGIPQKQRDAAAAKLSVIVIRSPSNQLEDLLPLSTTILRVLGSILPGQVVAVP